VTDRRAHQRDRVARCFHHGVFVRAAGQLPGAVAGRRMRTEGRNIRLCAPE
jgi:hypothetical protein